MKRYLRRATDHRAIVLESVATSPSNPTGAEIAKDCVGPDFTRKNVLTMISTLRREGLIAMNEDGRHYVTQAGLDCLAHWRFDRELPTFAERPASRKRRTS